MEIKVDDISFVYSGLRALNHVSFEVNSGDMLAIIGQNGSGKSTLLKCLNRILKVDKGIIRIGDVLLKDYSSGQLARTIAYIPQSEEVVEGMSVFDTVLLGRKPYIGRKPSIDDMKLVSGLLERLELQTVAMRSINTLSGGQQQRVYIARALAQQPAVLLLDEPIANLDMNHQMKVMKLLQQLASEGLIIVVTIHDINMAARFCNKVLMLKHGEVFAAGNCSVYTPENIENLFDIRVDVVCHKNGVCIVPQ